MCKAMDAIDYWQTVSINRPNGCGQQLNYTVGNGVQSHYALISYQRKHGKGSFNRSLDILFSKNN